jgi:RNA polymerase sigma factor (sigma-70 family)
VLDECHVPLLQDVYSDDATRGKDVTVTDPDRQVEAFEEHRTHLRAVAYRMLGTVHEADDAVQESWLRFDRLDDENVREIQNLRGWLTTVVSRICLDLLRARTTRREDPLGAHTSAVVAPDAAGHPEHEAELADSVGRALLVVLEALSPAERLAFVLHDLFALPFDEVAGTMGRSPAAVRQLASRARRRVQGTAAVPDRDLSGQRAVVDAFFAAAREGDFDALVAVLDPDIVLRSDGGVLRPAASVVLRGAAAVAGQALTYARLSPFVRPALVNGAAGVVVAPGGRPASIMGFTVAGGKIVAIDAIADPERLRALDLDLTVLDG